MNETKPVIEKVSSEMCKDCIHCIIRKKNGKPQYIVCLIGGIHDLENKSCNMLNVKK